MTPPQIFGVWLAAGRGEKCIGTQNKPATRSEPPTITAGDLPTTLQFSLGQGTNSYIWPTRLESADILGTLQHSRLLLILFHPITTLTIHLSGRLFCLIVALWESTSSTWLWSRKRGSRDLPRYGTLRHLPFKDMPSATTVAISIRSSEGSYVSHVLCFQAPDNL